MASNKKEYIYLKCDYFTCYEIRSYYNSKYQYVKNIDINKSHKSIYFKTTPREYKQVEIQLKFILFNEDIIKTSQCKTRVERLARDLYFLQKHNVLFGIYKFNIGKNILKDDIPNEINKYIMENINEKSLSDYSVDNLVLKN